MRKCLKCGLKRKLNQFFRDKNQCYPCINIKRRLRSEKNRKIYICKICNNEFFKKNSQEVCSLKCKLLKNINIKNDCWEWNKSLTNTGYGKLIHEGKSLISHRVSFEVFKGEIPEGLFVCHTCDNKKCINPDHLWAGTQKDNILDAKSKGRLPIQFGRKHTQETKEKFKKRLHSDRRGEKHHLRKLKNEDVFKIRNMLENGLTQTEIANQFGVHSSAISNIKNRKSWSHI